MGLQHMVSIPTRYTVQVPTDYKVDCGLGLFNPFKDLWKWSPCKDLPKWNPCKDLSKFSPFKDMPTSIELKTKHQISCEKSTIDCTVTLGVLLMAALIISLGGQICTQWWLISHEQTMVKLDFHKTIFNNQYLLNQVEKIDPDYIENVLSAISLPQSSPYTSSRYSYYKYAYFPIKLTKSLISSATSWKSLINPKTWLKGAAFIYNNRGKLWKMPGRIIKSMFSPQQKQISMGSDDENHEILQIEKPQWQQPICLDWHQTYSYFIIIYNEYEVILEDGVIEKDAPLENWELNILYTIPRQSYNLTYFHQIVFVVFFFVR